MKSLSQNDLEIKFIENPKKLKLEEKTELMKMNSELDNTQNKFDKFVKYYNSIGTDESKYNEMIASNPFVFFLINKQNNEYIGFITIHLNGMFKLAYISLFYIRPNYQHRGLGSYFLTQIESMLKDKYHIQLMSTSSLKNNKIANEMYKNMGFKVTGINYMKEL